MAIELKIPQVGESITEVEIGEWLKSEGDTVKKDENLVSIESEKATVDLPAPESGVLTKILKKKGETVEVGSVIGMLKKEGEAGGEKEDEEREESEAKAKGEKEEKAEKKEETETKEKKSEKEEKAERKPSKEEKEAEEESEEAKEKETKEKKEKAGEEKEEEPRIMPAARRLLDEHEISEEDVEGTGPGGRILKEDVQRHIEEREKEEKKKPEKAEKPEGEKKEEKPEAKEKASSAAGREEEVVPMTPLRRTVAKRLVEAQQTAALLTTFNEIDMSAVMAMRKDYQEAFLQKYKIKLGFMSFFVKACIDALKAVPQINAEIRDRNIVFKNYYDIGVAIGAEKGLAVPVIRNADRLSFAEVEMAIADFGKRAKENKLKLEELQGGTFTISNGGIYGSMLSTPIINPPQSGILGMHAIQERPMAVEGQVVIRPMMYVALTYDHRIVDGREAVTFLKRVKDVIEKPARMLIEI